MAAVEPARATQAMPKAPDVPVVGAPNEEESSRTAILVTPAAPPPVAPAPSPAPPAPHPTSVPMASHASIGALPAGQPWHVTPSAPPPAPVAGSPLVPPANPFANGTHDSQRSAPTMPPSLSDVSSRSRNAETIVTRKKSRAGLVIGLLATLAVTGALAFVISTKVLTPKEGPEVARSSDPHDTTTTTTAVTTTPSMTASTPPPPVSVATAPPSPEPEPVLSASAKVTLAKPPPSTSTTGTLKVRRRGWGHRVFIDGQVAGQGGKDITWLCGSHRVKVGSAGKENTVDIPCGGTVEID
jgi:hypothetical protein